MKRKHVIIGNSGAAISALQAIRSVNRADDVVIVSKENCLAYSPMLTTYYLSRDIPYRKMFICSKNFYRKNKVKTILGNKAVKVDPKSKAVYLEDGSTVEYDRLLIATGSSPRVPPIKGTNLRKVFTLWTAEDARSILFASRRLRRVTIVGGGLIGMQTLKAMVERGKDVALIEMLGQVVPDVLDSEGAEIIQNKVKEKGVDLRLNEKVLEIEEEKSKRVLLLSSGSRVEADVVILATGVTPNVDLIKGSGVRVSRGVLVDEYARTNVEDIYAAGDVAEGIDPVTGKPQIDATWSNATKQGWVAGLNMAGLRVPHVRNVRVNVSTIFNLSYASVGLIRGEPGRYEETSRRNGDSYRKLIFEGNYLVGALLVGEVDDAGVLVSFIERRQLYPNLRDYLQTGNAFVPYSKLFAAKKI